MRPLILMLGITTSATLAATAYLISLSPARAEEDVNAWRLLGAVEIDEVIEGESYQAIKTFPPGLVASADQFEITGYVVPIAAEAYMSRFILVEDPANCPFCGNAAGYGPVLLVQLKRPISELPEFSNVRVSGRIELIDDPKTYEAFRMVDAVTLPPEG
ncbi:MAG: hypothetical protein AAFW64_00580 [Pseudomonadota bacterium]